MSTQPASSPLQTSKLFKHLESKKEASTLGRSLSDIFTEFAGNVLPQLGQINQLFDEYTPHDALHIASLDLKMGERKTFSSWHDVMVWLELQSKSLGLR